MSLMLRLKLALSCRKVGTDRFGNTYHESRRLMPVYNRTRRYVLFAGPQDPTSVPAEWHAWLHHTTALPLPERKLFPWQQEHQPNLTGTALAYRPAGHDYAGGQRHPSVADYDAWTPEPRIPEA